MLQHTWSPTPASVSTNVAASWRPALAGRTPAGPVQAGGDRSSLSPEPSVSIPRWSLCCRSPSSAIRRLSSTDCTTLSVASPLALVPSLLQVPQFGIYCLTICVIRLRSQSSFGVTWKRIYLVCTLQAAHMRCFPICLRYINIHLLYCVETNA